MHSRKRLDGIQRTGAAAAVVVYGKIGYALRIQGGRNGRGFRLNGSGGVGVHDDLLLCRTDSKDHIRPKLLTGSELKTFKKLALKTLLGHLHLVGSGDQLRSLVVSVAVGSICRRLPFFDVGDDYLCIGDHSPSCVLDCAEDG